MTNKKFLLTMICLSGSLCALGETYVPSGDVSGEWTATGSPYWVEGEITIPADETLQIGPGVEVSFLTYNKFIINGYLEALGVEGDSIRFTCLDTDTGWHGLRFMTAPDNSHLAYCIIEWGYAVGTDDFYDFDNWGGGLYCEGSNPVIEHCSIRNNRCVRIGGGFAVLMYSNPRFEHCEFVGNVAELNNHGGGCCGQDSSPQFRNCTFRNNQAPVYAGGFGCAYNCDPLFVDCSFIDNQGGHAGGFFAGWECSPRLEGCLFTGNVALLIGGAAVDCYQGGSPVLVNCTIYDNSAAALGSAVYACEGSHPILANTICWGNSPVEILLWGNSEASSITIAHCDIEGGEEAIEVNNGHLYWLEGNLDSDPLFLPFAGNFTLQPSSPCIDAGTDYFYWEGYEVVNIPPEDYCGTAPDMGAFEYDPETIYTEALTIQQAFTLYPAYPNPFNPTTTISYSITNPADVQLLVYNISGQIVATLVDGWQGAGEYEVRFDGTALSSGIYFYLLEAGDFVDSKKMVLVK